MCRSVCCSAKPLPAPTTPNAWRKLWSSARNSKSGSPHLKERFEKESALVSCIRKLRGQLEDGAGDKDALRAELDKLSAELETLQGESPLMRVCVDGQIAGEVISAWTGIPVGKMLKDEIQTVLDLEGHLGSRVIGQSHALGRCQPAHSHFTGQPGRPEQTHRRIHARGSQRRRQN